MTPRLNALKRQVDRVGFVPIILALIVLSMAVAEPRFFNRLNILDMLRNFAFVSVVAAGQGLVMIVGGFDLSVGPVIALASILAATGMRIMTDEFGFAPLAATLLAIATSVGAGAFVGLVNGVLVVNLRAAAFMTTLGVATSLSGLIFFFTNGVPLRGLTELFTVDFGRMQILSLPIMFWIALCIVALIWFVMTMTPLGRHIYAVGANAASARIAGIGVTSLVYGIYAVSGALAAIVGLLLTARIGSGQSDLAGAAAMQSIAAAVVGGVSLKGGSGSIGRVALGALLIVVLSNALNLARIDSRYSTLALGVVLLVASFIEVRLRRESFDE